MPKIPQASGVDSTIAFVRDPYLFIASRAQALGADLFETRLLGQPTVCLTGPEAARFVYDQEHVVRRGAMPRVVATPLLGQGGVQNRDGDDHRHLKALFMSLMTPEGMADLTDRTAALWQERAADWATRGRVVLYDEAKLLITRAVCDWAGVPLPPSDLRRRAREMSARYEGAGMPGPAHLRARVAQHQTEAWIGGLIAGVRDGSLATPEGRALHAFATYRDLDGEPLGERVAGANLLSVLRPTVAVALWVTFVAHALHHHPDARERVRTGDDDDLTRFVQEVRRYYPFFPVVAARVRRDVDWQGYRFPAGRRVVLDLYGTDHDARTWRDPDAFLPERFREWDGDPSTFIPQGGGDHWPGHRCAGEWLTIRLMTQAAAFLARDLAYDVPAQDLTIDMHRIPAMPRSRFVMANVRPMAGRA